MKHKNFYPKIISTSCFPMWRFGCFDVEPLEDVLDKASIWINANNIDVLNIETIEPRNIQGNRIETGCYVRVWYNETSNKNIFRNNEEKTP